MKKIYKYLLSISMTIMMFFSYTPAKWIINAQNVSDTVADPNEFYTVPYTATYAASNGCSVTLRVTYTYRYESSNGTGKYITGVQGGTVVGYTGWTAVGYLNLSVLNTTYELNNQIAKIPFSYRGSTGAGYTNYVSGTFVINLYNTI